MPSRVMLKHPNPCHHTDTHTSFDPAKSEVDLRASHGLSLRLFRGGRALHSAVRGRAVRMGHEQDENSTLSSDRWNDNKIGTQKSDVAEGNSSDREHRPEQDGGNACSQANFHRNDDPFHRASFQGERSY